ncbi:MAG TPA: trehalose-phosphatase [Thermomicrobiales bacterium]|nr:trehalose-phosphatase [Thermomicrobiales bacterium]
MSTTANTIEQAAALCTDALAAVPSGLFSDFDGTLSPIAPTPPEAMFYPGAGEALARAAAHVSVAGIITGRAVDDVRAKVGLPELLYVGNHGLEWLDGGERVDHEAGLMAETGIRDAMERIASRLAEQTSLEGMLFENKRLSASIHYRNAPDPVNIGLQLLPIVEEEAAAHGLRTTSGKMLVELRPVAIVSKGTALEQIVRQRQLRGAVFFGDDVTDVDGFRALHRMRDQEGLKGVAIAIRSAEVHPDVIAEADVVLDGVPDTVALLNRIAERLEAKA